MVLESEEEGFTFKVGQTAKENWDIIKAASHKDLWFHLDNHSSPHVILHSINNDNPPKHIIRRAAEKCKEKSKLKNNDKVTVIYTQVKNVKRGTKVGDVFTKKTLKIVV